MKHFDEKDVCLWKLTRINCFHHNENISFLTLMSTKPCMGKIIPITYNCMYHDGVVSVFSCYLRKRKRTNFYYFSFFCNDSMFATSSQINLLYDIDIYLNSLAIFQRVLYIFLFFFKQGRSRLTQPRRGYRSRVRRSMRATRSSGTGACSTPSPQYVGKRASALSTQG